MTRLTADYLLIDGVLMPDAFNKVRSAHGVEDLVPLYLGTLWAKQKDLGPLLVKLAPDAELRDQVLAGTHGWPARASLLCSEAPSHEVARHLQRFVAPRNVHGGGGLLCFADPLVARHWLGSYEQQSLGAVLGPVQGWHVIATPHSWLPDAEPQWQGFERMSASTAWADSFAVLGQEQLDALNQAKRWRLTERLYASFQEHPGQLLKRIETPTLATWFAARLDEAQSWGLSSDRGMSIWVEYSLRWGDGFTQHPNGPYLRWLARTPDARALAPEMRIQRMDNDCQLIELDKDAP